MTWRELERLLREDGWSVLKRHGGSHIKYQHALKSGHVILSLHRWGAQVPRGTLGAILKQARLGGQKP